MYIYRLNFAILGEYLALSRVASLDVLATVLEEMPPFPEKESSGLLNLLKKKRPGAVPENPEIKYVKHTVARNEIVRNFQLF